MKILVWLCGLFCSSVLAATIPYTLNSDLLRGARVVFESQPKTGEYRLVLSSIKKVNSQWRAKEKVLANVEIYRQTLELEEFAHFADVLRQVKRELAGSTELTPVFQCSGLDCGSSNGWANEFLRVKQLYGMDTNQFYAVLAGLDAQQRETYIVWYLVQRGNGRIYLQQDQVKTAAGSSVGVALAPEIWSARLADQGYIVAPGLELNRATPAIADGALDLLVFLLQQDPDRIFRLVGHDYGAGKLVDRERRSLSYAQWLRDQLVERGVAAARLSIHGLGSLAPAGRSADARVEVVRD